MRVFNSLFFLLFVFFISCQKEEKHPVDFYYWKSKVSIGKVEKHYFEKLHSQKLYVRIFDIDKVNGQIQPVAKIDSFDSSLLKAEYIPVIFITNRTLQGLTQKDLSVLAENIYAQTDHILSKSTITSWNELQLDCDWTPSTHENYFYLLKQLKSLSGKKISCTLRLHQIKYKDKTGIPPVDKGYLMCYATSDPTDSSGKNSILDMALLKDYLSSISAYPLSFDVALPLYSWGIVTNHLGKIKLINGLTSEELSSAKFTKISKNTYQAKEDQFLNGLFISKDFIITLESISPELLTEAKTYLNKQIKKPYSIVYYHLDSKFIQRFTVRELE